MSSKERIEKLTYAAMPASVTRNFLKEFYKYGKGRWFFPEMPKMNDNEIGLWMRKNKKISDIKLLNKMTVFLERYDRPTFFRRFFRFFGIRAEKQAMKTPSRFWQARRGDCVAKSTVFGEMALCMGFKVEYYSTKKNEGFDSSRLTPAKRKEVLEEESGHSYVVIEGIQYDPTFGLAGTAHRGKKETREQRAATIWMNQGVILFDLEKFEQAIKAHNLAIEINPEYAEAWCDKGCAFHKLGKYEDALRCYDKAIELDPDDANSWNNKGITLERIGEYRGAIGCYEKTIEVDPMGIEAWCNKGSVLDGLGKHKEAIACYDKVIEMKVNYELVWYNKGVALAHLGKYEDAIKCYDRAIELNSRFAYAWYNKGELLVKLGNYKGASMCYDKITKIDPEDAEAWYNMGCMLDKLGRYKGAIECFKKLLELIPKAHPNRRAIEKRILDLKLAAQKKDQ